MCVRIDGGPVVDAHAHWYPEEWLKAVEADGAGAVKVSRAGEGWSMSSPPLTLSVAPDYVDIPKRLRNMDEQGVDVHALSLSVPMVHWASPELGLKLSRIYNDA